MPRRAAFALGLVLAAASSAGAAADGICGHWGEPEELGALDPAIDEASGLEVSPGRPDRLYHNNDSGDGPVIYVTNPAGALLRRIELLNVFTLDAEDLTEGPCGAARCLVLADIGDNLSLRGAVGFAMAEIPDGDGDAGVAPRALVSARYPDGAHNAEAAAMHPNGDLFVLTKDPEAAARLYRLTAAQLAAGGRQDLALTGVLDLAALNGPGIRRRQATAMDIAPDGSRLVVLAYNGAVEIALDLSAPDAAARLAAQAGWREGRDFARIPTRRLRQAEAVAYAADGKSILYDSERSDAGEAPLMLQRCLD